MKQIEIKIPEKEFTVDVEKRFLHNLIEKSIEKTNGTKNLSILLIKNNFIEMVKNTLPREYKITKLGEDHLERNKMYWQD